MLKLAVDGGAREAAALRAFAGEGAVRLLGFEPADGALLLERALPGGSLAPLVPGRQEATALAADISLAPLVPARDDEATSVAAATLLRLWRQPPPEPAFKPVAAFADDLERARPAAGLTAGLLSRARAVFAELVASAGPPRLLHGDLHHHNILDAGPRGWLAIDPKGVVGDPAYDTWALLLNPLGLADPARLAPRRAARLSAELGLDHERVQAWGFVGAVLSVAWSLEDHGRHDGRALAVAAALSAP